MSFFVKSKELQYIKNKFVILYILNVVDIILTLLLLRTGMYQEANIFMKSVINNEILSCIIKFTVPLILLMYIYMRMQKASEKQLDQANLIINVPLLFYVAIDLLHIVWSLMYFTTIY